jgi:23S rRNA pseudouridine2605 synthase
MTDELKPESGTPEDPPEISGEAPAESAAENADEQTGEAADNLSRAEDTEPSGNDASEDAEEESESSAKLRPPAKLERLQKILAQAGVASRRRAEELIEQGRVQVNGKIVTELGTKADAGRDHIRVDGKLLQGAERQRYFVLNKPKGFVTTVKDPEGRPTVMQFFEKMRERLYPVGRLDYMSEGLLLVTNDGELANKLTKASSGVEKTYLVKVSGQPTESELDILRGGVAIERGKPGSGVVRTAPARVRQVRQGDNPWYEVVLIEGRNRELRKMFEEIGHFVEKIRRVGYGPLVLDQEPGKLRELEPEELDALRKAADGKLRTPKAKELRRRNTLDKQLPTLAPKPSRPRPATPSFERNEAVRPDVRGAGEFRPRSRFGGERPERPARPTREGFRPTAGRTGAGPARFGAAKFGAGKPGPGKSGPAKFGAAKVGSDRPAWKKDDRPERTSGGFSAGPGRESRGGGDRAKPGFARGGRAGAGGSFGAKPPAWKKAGGGDRPAFKPPAAQRREVPADDEFTSRKPVRLQIDAVEPDRPSADQPSSSRPPFRGAGAGRPSVDRGGSGRTRTDRPRSDRTGTERGRTDRPAFNRTGSNRSSGGPGRTGAPAYAHGRPPRGEGGLARPFTSSSGKPRAGGARPSSKPSSGRSFTEGPRGASRPAAGSGSGPAGKAAWKPKPGAGGGSRPAAGGRSKPAFGAKPERFTKFGYKGKPGGGAGKRTGSRPGGPRPGGTRSGGPSSGKKRG